MIVVLASLALLSIQPRRVSKEQELAQLDSAIDQSSLTTIIPTDLSCTPENGVWMLGNLNTCRFLPLPGSEAKSSNLMMFYEGKKSMSMIHPLIICGPPDPFPLCTHLLFSPVVSSLIYSTTSGAV